MDKNTIYGLILMAAIFFGFMWLTPKNEETSRTSDRNKTEQEAPAPVNVDSLDSQERDWLLKNIAEQGETQVLSDSTHVSVLNTGGLSLTVAGDSLWGTINVDGQVLAVNDVLDGDLKKMTMAQQRKAVEMLRQASTDMGRYGRFAQFLNGKDSVLTLENNVIKLRLNSKTEIGRAHV